MNRAWVEINLDNIAHNLNEIKNKIGKDVKINAIIKADGYGHGAVETAKILSSCGVDMLSVATLDEAVQLRKKEIKEPLLVLGYVDSDRIKEIIDNDITVSVFNIESAIELSKKALNYKTKVNVHFKIDTGMNRIGFHYSNIDSIFQAFKLQGLNITGVFTHFANADEEDSAYTNQQYERFLEIINQLEERGHSIPLKHACNSGGIILHPDKYLNMVRPGIILYGLYPSKYTKVNSTLNLKRAMSFKARVIEVKNVGKYEPVSYGGTYITSKETKIATIACGYADGYSRILSGSANVMIKGKKAPIIGRICMDMCMADVSHIYDDIDMGDEAVLFDGFITVDELADICSTLNYEFICRIGMRVPRVYLKNHQIYRVQNYLLE